MVGLLALFHAGAAVIMPPNMQLGTLADLTNENDLLVTDIPAHRTNAMVLEPGEQHSGLTTTYDPGSVSIDFYTSGSSGTPKRVTRSALLLEREVALLTAQWGVGANLGLASATVSHQHVYGLVFKLLWPLSCGRPFSAVTHEVWETLLDELEPGGILVTSPAHLTRMAGIDPIGPERAPAMVLSAGSPLPQATAREAAKILGAAPAEMFGSTETGVCAIREATMSNDPWRPLPGVRFDVKADGRLKMLSPAVPGDGWYETADIVDLLPDGAFYFKGRADRVVKIEGKRVSLPAVERELAALPWAAAAAVTVVGTEFKRVGAVVVLTPSGKDLLGELGDFRFGRLLRKELARTQEPAGLPRLWRFVDTLPTGEMGKRRDRDLTALFIDGGQR